MMCRTFSIGLLVASLGLGCTQSDGFDSLDPSGDTMSASDEGSPDTNVEPPEGSWHEACPVEGIEERLLTVGDIQLNVGCRGDGPTVVFLHGFPEFHFAWNRVMDELAGEYRLVAPDLRGYNLSDKPEEVEAYRIEVLMDDVLKLLPLVSAEPVILVGHDWGGPVGWMVAHHPEAQIRGYLAVNGPHPLRFADLIANDPAQKAASAYMGFFRTPGSEDLMTPDVLAEQFVDFLTEEEMARYMEAWAQPGAILGGLNWYRANQLTEERIQAAMEPLSPTIKVPVSVFWGLDDTAVLASNAEELEGYAPDLVVETFPGVDHWIEHRIPKEVARGIRELDARTTTGDAPQ